MEASDMTDLLEEEFQTWGFFENIYFSDVSRLLEEMSVTTDMQMIPP